MDNKEKIRVVDFKSIFEKLGLQIKSNGVKEYLMQVPNSKRFSNGSYQYSEKNNMVVSHGNDRPQGDPYSFIKSYFHFTDADTFVWFRDNFGIGSEKIKSEPNTKKSDILENPEKFIIGENFTQEIMTQIKLWLSHRGFKHDYLDSEAGEKRIREVFKDYGFVRNPATKKVNGEWIPTKPCLIFFPKDDQEKICGVKMRKTNNKPEDETSNDSKSIHVTGSKNGVLIHDIDFIKSQKQLIISEGEPDYTILRMLGFDNVIGNTSGANNARNIIAHYIKNAEEIIVAYDNDEAGKQGAENLMRYCKRYMKYPKYEERYDEKENKYKDINDYFQGLYVKEDFERMFFYKEEIKEKAQEKQPIFHNRFFYNDVEMKYFDLMRYKLIGGFDIAEHLCMKVGDIKDMRKNGSIPTYKGVCYYEGGKEGFYNLMDENDILKPSNTPKFDERIEFLLRNLCNQNEINFEWLLKYIHYKYHNINDVLIPAIIFHGVGGTGKGLLELLKSTIYGKNNVQVGLNQRSLKSSFSEYRGEKIMVFFNEVGSSNEQVMKDISLKVKSMIMERTITVERKGQDAYSIENIAGFIFASNDSMPLKLDSSDTGNRRFTVIKTGKFIPREKDEKILYNGIYGIEIAKAVTDKKVVSDFLAYLDERFGDNPTTIQALDNEDKRLLEKAGQTAGDSFFEWFEEKYPNIKKITVKEKEFFLKIYRNEIGSDYTEDRLYSPRNFNHSLGVKYTYKTVNVRNNACKGYYIEKDVSGLGFFESPHFEEKDNSDLPF